ncbi:hypothetical protein DWY57_20505 [Bacteroides sp. AF25-5LB]|nr:hypothetical protein DWY57_20505 [Bacteroides sp. AF25-5LB]
MRGRLDARRTLKSLVADLRSIIFNVPFVVLRNEQGGLARIYSLLSMFCLKDRLVDSVDDLKQLKIIDWNKVNAIREKKKYFALGLIDKILR